jgi:AraC-like DNA-binding protein
MASAPHSDRARWVREHPGTYRLHRFLPVPEDLTPASFPRAGSLGRASTTDPAYWSSGRVRPDDDYWIFHYAMGGSGLLIDRAGEHPVPAGTAMLVRADDPDSLFRYPPGATARWEWLWLTFTGGSTTAMAADLAARHGPIFALDAADSVVRWLRRSTAGEGAHSVPPWDAREQVWRLLSDLADEAERATACPDDALAAAARRRIAQRLGDQELTVASLARDLGVSREHLARTVQRATGETPRQFIEESRLRSAKQLLRESGLSILAIARQCGWSDAETFASAFRRVHGTLPSAWRLSTRRLGSH